MQYIGDAKSGKLIGKDQLRSVSPSLLRHCDAEARLSRFGNRYFENLNPQEEIPGKAHKLHVSAQADRVFSAAYRSPSMG